MPSSISGQLKFKFQTDLKLICHNFIKCLLLDGYSFFFFFLLLYSVINKHPSCFYLFICCFFGGLLVFLQEILEQFDLLSFLPRNCHEDINSICSFQLIKPAPTSLSLSPPSLSLSLFIRISR